MEHNYIQLNFPTIVSVTLCGLFGYGLLVGSSILYKKMTGG